MNIKQKKIYVIDWDKVNTIEDMKEILMGLRLTVDPDICSERLKKFIIPSEHDEE